MGENPEWPKCVCCPLKESFAAHKYFKQYATKIVKLFSFHYCATGPCFQNNASTPRDVPIPLILHFCSHQQSVCMSVRPSVRLYIIRPSGEVPEQSKENAWKKWPKMWHVDIPWPPPERVRFWSVLAQFWASGVPKILVKLLFLGILRKRMEGMAWNVTCWCILTTPRNGSILASIGPMSALWWPQQIC